MRIDHVVWATSDLDAAAERFGVELRLPVLDGGIHPDWGTGNRIIALGEDYIELLGVVDRPTAERSWLGREILRLGADRWFTVCVDDPDLERTASRLHLEIAKGSRSLPDGETLRWVSAGLGSPERGDSLPFFIRWLVDRELHPSHMTQVEPGWAIGSVTTGAEPAELARWTGSAELPIVATGDGSGVIEVTVRSPRADVTIGSDLSR